MSMENLGPYTNFHELNQDWFLQEFNKLIAQWKDMQKSFDTLQDAFNDLKSYVQDYFKNLDVQEEINNKLNDMVSSGELNNLIMPFIKSSPVIVTDINQMTNHDYIYLLERDGFLYYWNGTAFIKSGINYSYPANAFVSNNYRFLTAKNKIAELNQCGSYSVGVANSNDVPVDLPKEWKDGNYMVVVDGYIGGNHNTYVQKIFKSDKTDYYYRIVDNNVGEWSKVTQKDYKYHNYILLKSENKISNLNQNGSYSLGVKNDADTPSDMPEGWRSGNYILTVDGYIGNETNSFIQTMYKKNTSEYFYRVVNDMQGNWIKMSGKSATTVKIALCGDSFIARGGDGGLPMSDYLNRYEKYNAVSLARGGIKASEWWDEFNPQINSTYDVFLISLGLNTETNVTVFKNSISTIINNLTTINPTARIILWCMDAWYSEEYSNACEEIANSFGIEFYSMKADARIPIRINGKFKSKFPNINENFVSSKTSAYHISDEDDHPNTKARIMLAEYWSTIL